MDELPIQLQIEGDDPRTAVGCGVSIRMGYTATSKTLTLVMEDNESAQNFLFALLSLYQNTGGLTKKQEEDIFDIIKGDTE